MLLVPAAMMRLTQRRALTKAKQSLSSTSQGTARLYWRLQMASWLLEAFFYTVSPKLR